MDDTYLASEFLGEEWYDEEDGEGRDLRTSIPEVNDLSSALAALPNDLDPEQVYPESTGFSNLDSNPTAFLTDDSQEIEETEESECDSFIPPNEQFVDEAGNMEPVPSRHVSKMRFCSRDEAQKMANYVLSVLEQDLFNYFEREEEEEDHEDHFHLHSLSSASIDSNYSDPLPGEPSTMKLFYEAEPTTDMRYADPNATMIDVQTQVNFHRPGKTKGKKDGSSITKEMTFVDDTTAELVFRHEYPLKDDYKPPVVPSRQASLDVVRKSAAQSNEMVDRPLVGPKIRWSKQRRLLPPLPQNYFKEETFWTGSVFRGKYLNRQFAHGRFEYPLMSVYESEFKDGHVHTDKHLGCVVYPRGDKFGGEWVKGQHISGQITFADDLKFEQHNWSYLTPPDRRFYIEKDIGLKQAGKTLFNDRFPAPYIAPGDYDTGYGIFNPDTGIVRGYSGEKIRDASYQECKWIMTVCRKVKKHNERYHPTFHESRIPGCSADKFLKQ